MDSELDVFDSKILDLVQKDCQLSAELIADAVGLSASAVQRRLRRMRQDKTIRAEVAVVNPQAVGDAMCFLSGLEIKDNYEALPRIRQWALAEPAVQQVFYVTGSFDLMMVVVARDVQAYDALAARLMAEIPQVVRMTTHVVIDTLKQSLFVPVAMNRP
ncbi:Lrp/AsnC family transcriptional regulator [Hylemonella sp. W303a]|uniref:Lrp/AsnC family transcriptional regulator n=1 Tax=Hylemonella sp. W303a TaxID=3389873 RepID=UPI00396B4324